MSATVRAMPAQKPGRSEQTVETPWAFLDAVEARFGLITHDLAATETNCKCRHVLKPRCHRFGPGSPMGEDALSEDWTRLVGALWLNPPFGDVAPWAEKCKASATHPPRLDTQRRICFLVPASLDTRWFHEHVYGHARIFALSGRLTFVGHESPYVKSLILAVYGEEPGFETWDWRKQRTDVEGR